MHEDTLTRHLHERGAANALGHVKLRASGSLFRYLHLLIHQLKAGACVGDSLNALSKVAFPHPN